MKKKWIIIVIAVVVLVLLGAAAWIWYSMGQPLYTPGMVRAAKNLAAPLTPPAQSAEDEPWLVEPAINIHHFSEGQGRNVLIIHGGPGTPYTKAWPGLAGLSGEYRFHYYDQRGCGQSTRPIDRFSSQNMYENMNTLERSLGLGAQIADIERIRRILGDDKLIVIGHSWGGFLAALYAAEFPEHIQKLILVSPANTLVMPQPDAESDLFASVGNSLPEGERAEYEAFMKSYMDFNSLFQRSEADLIAMNEKFGEYYMRVVKDIPIAEQGQPGGWMAWGMYMSMGQRHDYRPALAQITAPVLVLHGATDLQSEAATRLYADALPNATFKIIENAGHFSFSDQPEAFGAAVAEFLDE